MAQLTVQEQAERIYHQFDQQRAQYAKLGMKLSGVAAASVNEIAQHIQNCNDAAAAAGLEYLDSSAVKWGLTREQVFSLAEEKAHAARKSRGARALSQKYGRETAERIIAEKTGRHVSLKQ